MQKNRIAIASVLKPVKDPRAYFRFGISLRETNKYQINIIGFSPKKEPPEPDILFHTLFSKSRTDFSRMLVSWNFLRKIWKIRPKVLIVTTFELLPAAAFAKWFLKYKLVYDVQENHLLNIGQNKSRKGISKWFASALVSVFESSSRPFIDHYFLAERCYMDELPQFKPATILENRFFGLVTPVQPFKIPAEKKLRLLISGTITEVYGVLTGIQWFKELKKFRPNSELHVIGHCPLDSYRDQLKKEIQTQGMTLDISSDPIPYGRILEAYEHADIVLMPYWQIDSIREKIPSKLFESLALGKVCLFSPNPKWDKIVSQYHAGFGVDFSDLLAVPKVVSQLNTQVFFTKHPEKELTWKIQEADFLDVIAALVN